MWAPGFVYIISESQLNDTARFFRIKFSAITASIQFSST